MNNKELRNKLVFYTLMYIDKGEKRRLAGRMYSQEQRVDLYVKSLCVLDKSLRINGYGGGKCGYQ